LECVRSLLSAIDGYRYISYEHSLIIYCMRMQEDTLYRNYQDSD
jgi:hypothetical protein